MNDLMQQALGSALQQFDVMHLLEVVTAGAAPSEAEAKLLRTAKLVYGVPVAGEAAWQKTTAFLVSKNWDKLAFGYISSDEMAALVGAPAPKTLAKARPFVLAAMEAILNREPPLQLDAVIGCPSCGYLFGVHS